MNATYVTSLVDVGENSPAMERASGNQQVYEYRVVGEVCLRSHWLVVEVYLRNRCGTVERVEVPMLVEMGQSEMNPAVNCETRVMEERVLIEAVR